MRFYEILKEYTKHLLSKENLLEVDFNRKEVIEQALSAPISCGFEAETVWKSSSNDSDSDDVPFSGQAMVDVLDQLNASDRREVVDRFTTWLNETVIDDYLYPATEAFVEQSLEDRWYLRDFIDSNELRDKYTEYASDAMDGLDNLDLELTDTMYEFVKKYYESEYEEFLEETARESTDMWDIALKLARENHTIDEWIYFDYEGDVRLMLDDLEIDYGDFSDGGVSQTLRHIGDVIQSNFDKKVITGEYHHGGIDTNPNYWRVETDPSIRPDSDDDVAAEIISPVYATPADMLADINRLFDLFQQHNVYTNRSTGFHVTMSIRGKQTQQTPNELKMAMLLGDRYLLQQFDRLENAYTRSQMMGLEQAANRMVMNGANLKDIAQIEKVLSTGIDRGKYNSIHFKPQENSDGNQLVEFRIAGNDYLQNTDRVKKAIVKYSTVLLAGYDKNAYREDYAKTMLKLINRISAPLDKVRQEQKIPNTPFVNATLNFFKLFRFDLSSNEINRSKVMLNNIYTVKEDTGSHYRERQVQSFLNLIYLMTQKVHEHDHIKIPSSVVLGIRDGFSELNLEYRDFVRLMVKNNIKSPEWREQLLGAFRKLMGSKKIDIHPEDLPPKFVAKPYSYVYLAPWPVVRRMELGKMEMGKMQDGDLEKIIEIPKSEFDKLNAALDLRNDAIARGDNTLVKQIDEFYMDFNKKHKIHYHDQGIARDYPTLLPDTYDHVYQRFALSMLSDNGVVLELD